MALNAVVAERQTPQDDEAVEGRKRTLVADDIVIQNQLGCLHGRMSLHPVSQACQACKAHSANLELVWEGPTVSVRE